MLNLWRLMRWRGSATLRVPVLAILHLGYLWLITGTALLGLSQLQIGIPEVAAIHALTVGAMGTMVLGVMTRVSLGHTGRPLRAGWVTTLIYGLVNAAAFCRVVAAFSMTGRVALFDLSAGFWGAAFLLFVFRYGPMLVQPRVS